MRVSVCHCLECKKRSGSAFAVQARWPNERVELSGDATEWGYTGDSGSRAIFRFCPTCGSGISYASHAMAGLTAIPVGAFADPDFPPPQYSVYEERKHDWLAICGDGIEHMD